MSDDFRNYDGWKTQAPDPGHGRPKYRCERDLHTVYSRLTACWECAQDDAIATQRTLEQGQIVVCAAGHRRLVRDPAAPGPCWTCKAWERRPPAPAREGD